MSLNNLSGNIDQEPTIKTHKEHQETDQELKDLIKRFKLKLNDPDRPNPDSPEFNKTRVKILNESIKKGVSKDVAEKNINLMERSWRAQRELWQAELESAEFRLDNPQVRHTITETTTTIIEQQKNKSPKKKGPYIPYKELPKKAKSDASQLV